MADIVFPLFVVMQYRGDWETYYKSDDFVLLIFVSPGCT